MVLRHPWSQGERYDTKLRYRSEGIGRWLLEVHGGQSLGYQKQPLYVPGMAIIHCVNNLKEREVAFCIIERLIGTLVTCSDITVFVDDFTCCSKFATPRQVKA